MKRHHQAFFMLALVLYLAGCIQPNGGDEDDPPSETPASVWSIMPQAATDVKGQFTLTEGSATENPTLKYYYALSGTALPADNLHASWLAASWAQVEDVQIPVRYLAAGEYTVYGVAASGQHRTRSDAATVQVEGAIEPLVWHQNPQVDADEQGTVRIDSNAEAVNAINENTGTPTTYADPLPDYRFYYARYTRVEETGAEIKPVPPSVPTAGGDENWQSSGWTEIAAASAKTLSFGKYAFYGVASNNGGSLRYEFTDVALGGIPDWPDAPQVETGEEGSFTLTGYGTPGGYPAASLDDAVYYYGDGTLTPPDEEEQAQPEKWADRGWEIVKLNEPKTDITPAARDYQLYGAAANSLGVGIKKVEFTVNGLAEFKNVPDRYFDSLLYATPISSDGVPFYVPEVTGGRTGELFYNLYGYLYRKDNDINVIGGLRMPESDSESFRTFQGAGPVDYYTSPTHTGFTPIYFDGEFYLLGGIFDNQHRDTVSKVDGFFYNLTWSYSKPYWALPGGSIEIEEIPDSPGWLRGRWPARAHASAVAHEGALYLFAGEGADGVFFNDVWKSESEGRNWEKVAAAPWAPRSKAGTVSFNGRIWIAGGVGADDTYFDDVYSSSDGESWTKEPESGEKWGGRSQHSMFVFQDRLWVTGGRNGDTVLSDLWYSFNGREWTKFGNYPYVLSHPVAHSLGDRISIKDMEKMTAIEAEWINE